MASRGVVNRLGFITDVEYKNTGNDFGNASEIIGIGTNHSLPDYSHSGPNRIYVKTDSNGFRAMRVYGDNGKAKLEIAYHPERNLKPNGANVLHYHLFDENLVRTRAAFLTDELYEQYRQYLNHWGIYFNE